MEKLDHKEELDLILRAKNRDQVAFEELCKQYTALLVGSANKFYRSYKDKALLEDFIQEARIAFNNAILHYGEVLEGKKRAPFCAYAEVSVNNRLKSFCRKLSSKKNANCEIVSPVIEDYIQDAVVYRELLNLAENTLSPYEKRILQLKADGLSVNEIAKIVGKSEKSVNNAMYRVRSKIRDTIK